MADILIEDEDGAPYPEVLAIYAPGMEPALWLPSNSYDNGFAQRYADANKHLGWKTVRCQLVPIKQEGESDGRSDADH